MSKKPTQKNAEEKRKFEQELQKDMDCIFNKKELLKTAEKELPKDLIPIEVIAVGETGCFLDTFSQNDFKELYVKLYHSTENLSLLYQHVSNELNLGQSLKEFEYFICPIQMLQLDSTYALVFDNKFFSLKDFKFSIDFNPDPKIFYNVIMGMEVMHKKGYTHGDINLYNIVLEIRLLKITGYGSSQLTVNKMECPFTKNVYKSPESIKEHVCQPSQDIWSFGILLFELFEKKTPFEKPSLFETIQ